MNMTEKLDLVILHFGKGYENSTIAITSLCIPSLTLQDGPDGLAFKDTGVTQLPASLALAATFSPSLAYQYGQVLGSEAKHQGIDVVQAPNLNIDRVPNSGRAFEGFGEDPLLVASLGVSDIEGIQSEGVMADAKHFTAYNQETDRIGIDESVSLRALEEIYLPPFKAAVEQAHVASIMCSYGNLNGVNDCESGTLFHILYDTWRFPGFVRSDLTSVTNSARAIDVGLDMIKPATKTELEREITKRQLTMTAINRAALRVLIEMFTYHLVTHPLLGHLDRKVETPADRSAALLVAEKGMVLLKDQNAILPLHSTSLKSVAVIGNDASVGAQTAGQGSAYVEPPFVVSPLAAITKTVGSKAVTYADGGSSEGPFPRIPTSEISPSSGLSRVYVGAHNATAASNRLLAKSGLVATGPIPPAIFRSLPTKRFTFTPTTSGLYTFSMMDKGNSWLYLNHSLLIARVGIQALSTWSVSVNLVAGVHYPMQLTYFIGPNSVAPTIGMQFQSHRIALAVAAARAARVAIVFVSCSSSEGADRPTLALPGDENALISAVAAANRRTIVVLNTGGAVLMPWLSKVGGVIEAWLPGEEDGTASANVLFGRIDPSGHLPVTFPRSNSQSPTHAKASWPGVDGVTTYTEGIDVGYRYFQTHHILPLFPFGFGLSYTQFALSELNVTDSATGYSMTIDATNTGTRFGTAKVQSYLAFPTSAGEPPEKLVAYGSAALAPGASATLRLSIPASSFLTFLRNSWRPIAGTYTLSVGQSSAYLPIWRSIVAPQLSLNA